MGGNLISLDTATDISLEDMELVSLTEIPNKSISSNKLAHSAINLAYNSADPDKYLAKALEIDGKELVGSGFEIFATSSELNTSQYGYKAVAFINKQTKEIHIASAGTKADKHDLWDDMLITFHYTPNKLASAKEFIDAIIAKIAKEENKEEAVQNYTFSTSGHSLGAIVSDLTAVELYSRNFKFNKSTTFDSPGSSEVVKYAIQEKLFTGEVKSSIEELAKHSVIYNAKPNFINTTNTSFGEVNLVLPQVKNNIVEEHKTPKAAGLWGWGEYLYNTIGSVIQTSIDYLGITSITEQINQHKLHNFADLDKLVYAIEGWNETQPILRDDKNNAQFKAVKSTGKDVVLFDEHEYGSLVLIDQYPLAYSDLQNYTMEEVLPIGDMNNNLILVC